MKAKTAATLSLWAAAAAIVSIPVAIEVQYRSIVRNAPKPPPCNATIIHAWPQDWDQIPWPTHHNNDFSTTYVEPTMPPG